MTQQEFQAQVEETAGRILAALASGRKTAWDLKVELKITHTLLHLALGALLGRGRVRLAPDRLTYAVEAVAEPAAAPPAVPA